MVCSYQDKIISLIFYDFSKADNKFILLQRSRKKLESSKPVDINLHLRLYY